MNIESFQPSPLKNKRLNTVWQDYWDALNLFMQDWHNPDITERYIAATRRWKDASAEEAGKGGEL